MTKQYINQEKMLRLQKQVYDNACAHGWHGEPVSAEHLLGLIMTEVAEAVEADRNGRRANTEMMDEIIKTQTESVEGLTERWYEMWFSVYYKDYIKSGIEEEFADVVIRILDMANEVHGDKMVWEGSYPVGGRYREDKSFIENAWFFIRDFLNTGCINLSDSVSFMYDWAERLDIDLDKHIAWKMKYNEMRPYRHGGKKY